MADAEISVVAELIAKIDNAVAGFNEVADAFHASMDKLKDHASEGGEAAGEELHKSFGEKAGEAGEHGAEEFGDAFREGALAAAATIALEFLDKVKESVEGAAQYATKLNVLRIETGDSEENLQKLEYAMASVGVGAEQAQMMFVRFQRAIAMAADNHNGRSMLERLGLDPKMMKGQGVSENLDLLADKIKNLSSASEKASVAQQLFGRAGAQLLPVLEEGGPALDKLKEAAESAGAVMGGEALEKFHAFHIAVMQLKDTSEVFYSSFALPFMDAVLFVEKAIQRMMASLEKLNNNERVGSVAAALMVVTVAAEKLIELFKSPTTPAFLSDFAKFAEGAIAPLRMIITVVSILWAMWQNDIGGMQELIKNLWTICVKVAQDISSAFNDIIKPALDDLIDSFGNIIQSVTDVSNNVASSKQGWEAFRDVLAAVFKVIADVIEIAARIVNGFNDAKDAVIALTGVLIILNSQAIATVISGAASMALAFGAQIPAAIATLIRGLEALRLAIALFAVGADVAIDTIFPPMALLQIAIALVGVAIVWMGTHWNQTVSIFQMGLAILLEGCYEIVQGFKKVVDAIIDVCYAFPGLSGAVPILESIGNAASQAADKLHGMAINAYLAAQAAKTAQQVKNNDSLVYKNPNWGAEAAMYGAQQKPEEKKEDDGGGTGHLAPIPKTGGDHGKAAEAMREQIDALKRALEPFKEAIRDTEFAISKLESSYKELGEIDSPRKLASAEHNLSLRVAETWKEMQQQNAMAKTAADSAAKLTALEKGSKDPKIAREYHSAAQEMISQEQQARLKAISLHEKEMELLKEKKKLYVDEAKTEADNATTLDAKITKLKAELDVMKSQHTAAKDLLDVQKQIADAVSKRVEMQQEPSKEQRAAQGEQLKFETDMRANTPLGPDPTGELAQQRQEEDAAAAVAQAQLKLQDTVDAVNVAQAEYNSLLSSGTKDQQTLLDAQKKLKDAMLQQTQAQDALTVEQQKALNVEQQTDQETLKVRDGFVKLAEQAAGPLYNAFQEIINGGNPLVTMFQALFQQTGSFRDIQNAFKEITQAVAEIFDALRPVLDFFLGILIGIVNIFIMLYNTIVSLVNVLGFGIQKIKLLTDNLNALNGGPTQLLTITHDLPTANEYNSDKWGPLIAQQEENANNNLAAGFNDQSTKLGSIIGELIGIRMILYVIQGAGLLGQNSSGGGLLGMFNGLKNKLFGGGSSAGTNTDLDKNSAALQALNSEATQQTAAIQQSLTAQQQASGLLTNNNTLTQAGNALTQTNNASDQQVSAGLTPVPGALGTNTAGLNSVVAAINSLITALNNAASAFSSSSGGGGGLFGIPGLPSIPGLSSIPGLGALATPAAAAGSADMGNASFGSWDDAVTTNTTALNDSTEATTSNVTAIAGSQGLTNVLKSASTAMAYVGGGLELFKGLSKGGTFGETLGGAGAIVGTIFGGPLGGLIGGLAGNLIGSLFGPKHSGSQPDLHDPNFGNDEVGLTGQPFGTQGFGAGVMPQWVQQLTGGEGLLQYIQQAIASGNSGLDAATQALFGSTGGGKINYGHNIENESVVGGTFSGNYQDLWNDAVAAAQQIAQHLDQGVTNLSQAINVNLAKLYGNGVSTLNGGYSLTPGGAQQSTGVIPNTQGALSIPITINHLHGTMTKDDVAVAFAPLQESILNEIGRRQQRVTRNQNYVTGRDTYAQEF